MARRSADDVVYVTERHCGCALHNILGLNIGPGRMKGHEQNKLPWAGHTLSQTSLLMMTWLSDRDLMARTMIFSTIGLLPWIAELCSVCRSPARDLLSLLVTLAGLHVGHETQQC